MIHNTHGILHVTSVVKSALKACIYGRFRVGLPHVSVGRA